MTSLNGTVLIFIVHDESKPSRQSKLKDKFWIIYCDNFHSLVLQANDKIKYMQIDKLFKKALMYSMNDFRHLNPTFQVQLWPSSHSEKIPSHRFIIYVWTEQKAEMLCLWGRTEGGGCVGVEDSFKNMGIHS